MIYRDVLAEVRRPHGEAPWQLTGVVVDGRWLPADPRIEPASARSIEAGHVELRRLPRFIANDVLDALSVAVCVAEMQGIEAAPRWAPSRWHEVSV